MSRNSADIRSRRRKKPVTAVRCGSQSGSRAARRGFTLVELLVVVAIIALLISILLPALGNARQQGKQAVCLSNMRQMGFALLSYALENGEHVPTSSCPLAEPDIEHPEKYYWLNVLQEYSQQPLIGRCRNDETTKPFLNWSDPPPRDQWQQYRWSSYAVNACVGPLKSILALERINQIQNPASVIFLAEIRAGDSYDYADHFHADLWEAQEDPKQSVAWDRHVGKSNYLFIDSHAKTHRWQETWNFPLVNMWWPEHAPGWPPELLPPTP
ncbi:MAG: prepilin-type N-terminal cleavage/methylation domain-containing protein [Phycisphaerae bacterium]